MLALLLATGAELVRGQARAVEVNAAKLAAALVVVIEFAAVRQAAMTQLTKRVVLVTRCAPALMLGDQAVLQIIFISERPVTVVDADQAAESVVAVMDRAAIGLGFDQQAASAVALILGDEFAAVVAELGFLEQLAVEVVFVGGSAAVEAGFPLDQAIAVVVEVIVLAALVFDFGEQQAGIVVAITQLAAIRVAAEADQMQVVGVFIAGDAAQLIAFGSDFAIGVVGERAGGAAGQGDLCQTVDCAF